MSKLGLGTELETKTNVTVQTKKKSESKFVREIKKNFPLFVMLLPGACLVLLFSYAPLYGLTLAFKEYKISLGPWSSPWIGFDNFSIFVRDTLFRDAIKNTILYNIIFLSLGLTSAVSFAVALNELKQHVGKKIYQTIIMLPHFLSWVIVSFLVYAFLNPGSGLVTRSILPALGMMPADENLFNAYATPAVWIFILPFINLWKHVGYSSIVYFAAIAGIDQEMYEAALIDGATKWQQIRHITVPSLYPLMIILTTLNVGKIFNSDFGLFYQVPMDSGAVFSATQVIDTYIFRLLRVNQQSKNIGVAAAAGFCQSIMGFTLVFTTNMIVRKIDPEKSLF